MSATKLTHSKPRLFLLTVVMCVISAIGAIVQVTRIDPGMVFTR